MEVENVKGYEKIDRRTIEELKSEGTLWIHRQSGARIFTVENSDPNKVFYVGFRTPPVDSTGVAHILEHSVLCGSEKFPVKDPFIELVKGSLNTFLNAMTYPDKTVYPVASCNDTDFQNLMDVYMDAVFHPNIYKEEKIFFQEGWHYELKDAADDLKYNGVVYNEMKGAFSSAEGVLDREIMNSLFPDTPYGVESGGDPQNIPDLTYEQFLDFHRKYYHPSNSFLYLYGDINMEEKLLWLDKEYLSHYEKIKVDSAIPKQAPFDSPKEFKKYYSIQSQESCQDKTFLSWNKVISTNLDIKTSLAFSVLDYVLISSSGALLREALLDAKIGKDILGGFDNGICQPMFSVVSKDANDIQKEEFIQVIEKTLEKLVNEGINKKTLLAAINHEEFRTREADFGRYPKGLIFGLNCLDSWLYDEKDPYLYLQTDSVFAFLKEKVDTDYFEQLIKTYLLDNPHASVLLLSPRQGLTAKTDKETAEKLKAYKASLSDDEIDILVNKTLELEKYQSEPSKKEELEKIPLLKRSDISKKIQPIYNEALKMDDTDVLYHNIFTNKIIYVSFLFDIKHIEEKYLPYIGILKQLLGNLSTENYSYQELTDEIHIKTGGIGTDIGVYSEVYQTQSYELKFEVYGKALFENRKSMLELIREIIGKTLFDDDKHLYELIAQMKSRLEMTLNGSGHTVAAVRAMSGFSETAYINDRTGGIGFYRVIDKIEADFENKKEELKEICLFLMKQIFREDHLLVSITCDREGMDGFEEELKDFKSCLQKEKTGGPMLEIRLKQEKEGFLSASKVQYVARCGNYMEKGFSYTGALRVLKTILGYDFLWNKVRVLGGAYGCMNNYARNGNVYFTSYRDPNLENTISVYEQIPEYLESFDADEREMTKYVIGTISETDTPLTPSAEGNRGLAAALCKITEDVLQKEREEILNVTKEDIRALKPLIEAVLSMDALCVIGNEERIREQKDLFDKIEDFM